MSQLLVQLEKLETPPTSSSEGDSSTRLEEHSEITPHRSESTQEEMTRSTRSPDPFTPTGSDSGSSPHRLESNQEERFRVVDNPTFQPFTPEVWALKGLGVSYILQEMLTIKSDHT